ncbi:MAG: NAD-dependent malic enzyme [Gammaproteobacteria bacterium]|nr:NAD-dependent malic enzyme [Gammaproteobacteria bacterium]
MNAKALRTNSSDAGSTTGSRHLITPDTDTLKIKERGHALVRHPFYNKGTAFTREERQAFGIEGMLPSQCNTQDEQVRRVTGWMKRKKSNMEKYLGLASLHDRNEHLFYRMLIDGLQEYMPIVYTPTVGDATKKFSDTFRRGRGIWITPDHKGRIAEVLKDGTDGRNTALMVATDSESILGIGDQGAGGMAISIGKLALYVAAAGIHPRQTLPVCLDVGTDNDTLLNDELYLGWRHPRLRGQEYDELIEEFVQAVKSVCPGALLQWEDFRKDNALAILDRYRHQVLSFNDDIQGTGAVAVAGFMCAVEESGSTLADQRVIMYGAGAAGLGIARQIRAAFTESGMSDEEVTERVAVLDRHGLLINGDGHEIDADYKRELAWPLALAEKYGLSNSDQKGLEQVLKAMKPTCLIGASGQARSFTEDLVKFMHSYTERPIILPYSNPTDLAEATPEDLLKWTDGQALVATGSPFAAVRWLDRKVCIGQGNNVFIFPGLGLGALIAEAKYVSDDMITAASKALADAVLPEEKKVGLLYPDVPRLRDVTKTVAAAVLQQAVNEGLAQVEKATIDGWGEIDEATVEQYMWSPKYPQLVPA